MAIPAADTPRLRELLAKLTEGLLAPPEEEDLSRLLNGDDAARAFYRSYIAMDALLWWEYSLSAGPATCNSSLTGDRRRPSDITIAETSLGHAPAASPTFPALAFFHGTVGYFSQGMPLAYVLATVVTGLGLLIGSLVHVSAPEQIARQSIPLPSPLSPLPSVVGRITGMIDCKWPGDCRVSLGQKYELASGLMEITYNTGAKVILQGPVTYEVDSNGGYLAVGKLTGKLEKKPGKLEIRNQKSEIPAFAVRTPTATITDLGTEFGVEVDRAGDTETHVFVGEVQTTAAGGQGNAAAQTRVIRAGQFARIGRNDGLSVGMQRPLESAKRFIRAMPERLSSADAYAELVLSMKPVVYYRMEQQWTKNEKNNCYVLVDSAPGAHHGEMHVDEAFGPRCRGRFGSALDLHGPGVGDYAIVPDYPKTDNDQLSVSAWAWAAGLDANGGAIVENWSLLPPRNASLIGQFALAVLPNFNLLAAVLQPSGAHVWVCESSREFPRCVWQHVAFVADGAILRLYRNGIEIGAVPYRGISRQGLVKNLSIGCAMDASGARPRKPNEGFWDGRLDEIAVFNHSLSAEQVRQLYVGSATIVKPSAGHSGGNKNHFLETDPTR